MFGQTTGISETSITSNSNPISPANLNKMSDKKKNNQKKIIKVNDFSKNNENKIKIKEF